MGEVGSFQSLSVFTSFGANLCSGEQYACLATHGFDNRGQSKPIKTLFRPLVEALDLSNQSVSERTANLQRVPWETLVKSELNVRVFPSISNGFVPLESDPERHQEQVAKHFSWCKNLMVGDCAQDVSTVQLDTIRVVNVTGIGVLPKTIEVRFA